MLKSDPVNLNLKSDSSHAGDPKTTAKPVVCGHCVRVFKAIVISAVAILAAFNFDDTTSNWMSAHQVFALKRASGTISHFGDWPYLMALGLILLFVFARLHQRRWMRIVCIMMISSSLAGAIANTVRLTTGRTRPNSETKEGWYGPRHEGKWLIFKNEFNSFPSGHTATAIGFVVPLLLLAPEAGVPALFLALLICGSRIYLGVHHLSDIAVASVIAYWVARAVSCKWAQGGNRESATQDGIGDRSETLLKSGMH